MKKKIYIDFDGCIYDTIKAICTLYNEDFQYYSDYHYVNAEDIKSWDFDELNCANRDYINIYFNQKRFFDKLDFFKNAKDVLLILNNILNIEINIVSMGYSPNLKAKEVFIKKSLPFCKFIGVNFKEYKDKSHINMSDGIAFIDDSTKNLETSNCSRKILYGQNFNWNKGWTGERIYDWRELEV